MSYLKRAETSTQSSKLITNQYAYKPMTYKPPFLLKEDGEQKIPLFLIKLWNIVEDPAYQEVVRWDETGLSFHIMDPYAFCSNILPQYFKHKNLNSLVRQLNMYGFRKNTPIDRSGLARAESDQDHLEFMHPYFRRDHPELLANIKRKVSNSKLHSDTPSIQQLQQAITVGADGNSGMGVAEGAVAVHTKDLTSIFDELKNLRDRQRNMELRMDEMTKENEMLWTEMAHVRGAHLKQQQIVNKLIQFLVALVGPNSKQQGRLGKRHLSGRSVNGGNGPNTTAAATHQQLQSIMPPNATEILDRLMNDIGTSESGRPFVGASTGQAENYIFEHQLPQQTNHHLIDNRANMASNIDSNNQIEVGAFMHRNLANPNESKLQIQPYYGKNNLAVSGSTMAASPANSGPIIAELIDELEENGGTTGRAEISSEYQQIGNPIPQSGHRMAVAVSSPMTMNELIPAEENSNFRGYSQSFGGQSAPAAKKQAFQVNSQKQQPFSQLPEKTPTLRSTSQQQPMAQKGQIHQQQQSPPQQQQPLVIYHQIPSNLIHSSQFPAQQNQPIVKLNPQKYHHQQQQRSMVPQTSAIETISPPQQFQQMQPIQQIGQMSPISGQQEHQYGRQIKVEQQQPPFGRDGENPLPDDGQQQLSHDGQNTLDAPLTEGMLLNEHEIADITGLNDYLDENDVRFQTLTNSIAEHWDNMSMGGGDISPDDFQDLFDYGESTSSNINDQQNNQNGASSPYSSQHFE